MPASKQVLWQVLRFAPVLALLYLAGCNLPAVETQGTTEINSAQVMQTALASPTQVAETALAVDHPGQIEASQAPAEAGEHQPIPSAASQPVEIPGANCDLAAAGNPIDITIPDDSMVEAKQVFTKVWRLENAGTCTWTEEYVLGHFSGDTLGARSTVAVEQDVRPGESIELSIDMVAPENTGTYQSNWKLRNPAGEWFGIGPTGDAPIWVRIVVVPQVAAITKTSPALSALGLSSDNSPVILVAGSITLKPDDQIDLDRSQINVDTGTDLTYQIDPAGKHLLIPMAGANLSVFSSKSPAYGDCLAAPPNDILLVIEDLSLGFYLCYRTSEDSPGWIRLAGLNALDHSLVLELITWKAP